MTIKKIAKDAIRGDWIIALLFLGLASVCTLLERVPFGKHDVINTTENPTLFWLTVGILLIVGVTFIFRPFIISNS